MRPRDKRKRRARREARSLLLLATEHVTIDSIIQCGLGDWAEGPTLLKMYPSASYLAVEPIHRYCHETWAAGFRGPIIQGLLWNETGLEKTLNDWRTRTSVYDESQHGLGPITAYTVTLDDAVERTAFRGKSILLWMDVEGAELEILKGAGETLKSVQSIISELKKGTKFPGWPEAEEVVSFLLSIGFELKETIRCNGVFVRKQSKDIDSRPLLQD